MFSFSTKCYLTSFLLSQLFMIALGLSMTYNQYKYVGYRNTWHVGTQHIGRIIGTFNGSQKKVEMVCANYCTLDTTCNGFYIENATDGNCHMVILSLETNKNLTYGTNQSFSRVYFQKVELSPVTNLILPTMLGQPCVPDGSQPLTTAQCTSATNKELVYYNCTASNNNYLATINLISDAVCSDETRLQQCNLLNGSASSNILPMTRFDILNPAFVKYIYSNNGTVSNPGDEIIWVEGTFPVAKNLTRIILRVADPNVDKIQSGNITVTSATGSARIFFNLPTVDTCAVGFVFARSSVTNMPSIAAAATKFRLDIISKFTTVKGNVGFKIDVFYK